MTCLAQTAEVTNKCKGRQTELRLRRTCCLIDLNSPYSSVCRDVNRYLTCKAKFYCIFDFNILCWCQLAVQRVHNYKSPIASGVQIISYAKAFMAKSLAQSLPFKSVTDKKFLKNKNKKHRPFSPSAGGAKSQPLRTPHGNRGCTYHLALPKSFHITCIVSLLGTLKLRGETHPEL